MKYLHFRAMKVLYDKCQIIFVFFSSVCHLESRCEETACRFSFITS